MSNTKIPLSLVKVASPCTAAWDTMSGDDTTRFCGQCAQYVYNLSAMTQEEAESLISETEGKMCVRYFRRADGTMMTKDCPVGWRAIKRRTALIGGAAVAFTVAVFSVLTLGIFAASIRGNGNGGMRVANPIQRVHDWLFPPAVMGGMAPPVAMPPPGGGNFVLGEMCPPPVIEMPPIDEPMPPGQAVPVVPQPEDLKK